MRSELTEVTGIHIQSSEQTSRAEANSLFPLWYALHRIDKCLASKQDVVPDKQDMTLRAMRACSCVPLDDASNIGEA